MIFEALTPYQRVHLAKGRHKWYSAEDDSNLDRLQKGHYATTPGQWMYLVCLPQSRDLPIHHSSLEENSHPKQLVNSVYGVTELRNVRILEHLITLPTPVPNKKYSPLPQRSIPRQPATFFP